jgi:hypothetical protein
MERQDFYDDSTYENLLSRIGRLTAETGAEWGKMTAAQMCSHCAEVAEVANGKALVNTPWYVRLMGGLIKKMVMSEKPYPRSSKTHPQFEIETALDFEEQKTRLLEVLQAMHSAGRARVEEVRHPIFGQLTADEQGWATYKHLDHHLKQFGV